MRVRLRVRVRLRLRLRLRRRVRVRGRLRVLEPAHGATLAAARRPADLVRVRVRVS